MRPEFETANQRDREGQYTGTANFVENSTRTLREITFNPGLFFRRLAQDDERSSIPRTLSFAAACFTVSSVAYWGSRSLDAWIRGSESNFLFLAISVAGSAIIVPFLSLVMLFLIAAISHLLCSFELMSRGGTRGFRATLRATSYSLPIASLVSWVPVANIAACLWGLYLYAVALSEAHGMSRGRSMIVIVELLLLVGLLSLVVFGGGGYRALVGIGLFLSFVYYFLPLPVVVGISLFLIIVGFMLYPPLILIAFAVMFIYVTFLYRP